MDLADQDVTPSDDNGDPTPGDTGDATPSAEGDGGASKTFTQEEVNALMAREVSKATRGKLDPKELGFTSAKEVQDFLATAKELTEQQKTEAEKELEAKVKEAREQTRTEILGQAKQIALRAEFKVQAAQAGVVDPEGAFILAQTESGWDEIEVADNGAVTGLDTAFFDAFKESKPYLFGETPTSGDGRPPAPKINPGAGGASADDAAQRASELAKRYPALQQAGIRVQP